MLSPEEKFTGWWVGGEWQTKFSVSPGPGLWPLVLGPFGPDLGPDLDLTWDLDLDLSLTILIVIVTNYVCDALTICVFKCKSLEEIYKR